MPGPYTRAGLISSGYGSYAPHVLRGALEGDSRASFSDVEVAQLIGAWLSTPTAPDPPEPGGFRAVVLDVGEEPVDGDVVTRAGGVWTSAPGGGGGSGSLVYDGGNAAATYAVTYDGGSASSTYSLNLDGGPA